MDAPAPKDLNPKKAIDKLHKEKNAIILAHYYQIGDIQDTTDYVGDSLALAQWATKTKVGIIVFCGIHLMGEAVKILCPDKKVLVPDLNAGCSLADSCPAPELAEFIKQHPGHTVVSYVNTTAAVGAVTDVMVTPINTRQIMESFPEDTPMIFDPDRNLGNYINSITGRNMLLWDGTCHVHEQFSLEKILSLKRQYPSTEAITHPERKQPAVQVSDFIGSTTALPEYAIKSDVRQFIITTESDVIYEIRKQSPGKEPIPAPPNDSTCAYNECNFVRLNTMEKLYNCLKFETPGIFADEEVQKKAIEPIEKMLGISEKPGL